MVEAGVLRGLLSSRATAGLLGRPGGGSMPADGWTRMPLVRMTNLHLEPGEATSRTSWRTWTRVSSSRRTGAGRSTTDG